MVTETHTNENEYVAQWRGLGCVCDPLEESSDAHVEHITKLYKNGRKAGKLLSTQIGK